VQLARLFLALGAVSAGISVVLGAFAAHGLKARLDATALGVFQTGVTYQSLHSLALCILALWLMKQGRVVTLADAGAVAGVAFIVGIFCFSGSLYGLSLGAPRWLGPVTPFGGLAFIIGWFAFAWSAWRS
jgi:uncharacterized membrane protein YgdD (TMEM256/DUF423 family)